MTSAAATAIWPDEESVDVTERLDRALVERERYQAACGRAVNGTQLLTWLCERAINGLVDAGKTEFAAECEVELQRIVAQIRCDPADRVRIGAGDVP